VPLSRRFDDSRCSFFGIDSAIREAFHAYGATKKTAIRPNSYSREMVEKFPGSAGGLRWVEATDKKCSVRDEERGPHDGRQDIRRMLSVVNLFSIGVPRGRRRKNDATDRSNLAKTF
jgi:hypothetical protein